MFLIQKAEHHRAAFFAPGIVQTPTPPRHFALEFPFCFGVVCLGAGLVAQEVERTPAVVAAPDPARWRPLRRSRPLTAAAPRTASQPGAYANVE